MSPHRAAVLVAVAPLLASCTDASDPVTGPLLPQPDAYTSKGGELHLRVEAKEVTSTIDGKMYGGILTYDTTLVDEQGVETRGDASAYVGAEWRVQPGDRLVIDYVNSLGPYKFVPKGEVDEGCDDHRLPQPLNLHTHGLTVSPAGNADNVLLSIPPGRSNRYEIQIPEGQHRGLYWYHPHIHGLTDDQVYGGLAGHIVVGRADGDYQEFDGLSIVPMMLRYNVLALGTGCDQGRLIDASPVNVHGTALVRDGGDMIYTVNGRVAPLIPLRPADPSREIAAESQIWAISNITGSASYLLALEEIDIDIARQVNAVGRPLDIVIVSIDGSPMQAPIVLSGDDAKRGYHLPQGGRVAILVQGASRPSLAVRMLQVQNRSGSGDASANDLVGQPGGGWRDYTLDLLAVGSGDPSPEAPHVDTPAKLTVDEKVQTLSIADEPIAHDRTFLFGSVLPATDETPNNFPIDDHLFPDNPVAQPRAQTVERWTILNQSSLLHPFHFHTQYGQVEEIVAPLNLAFDTTFVPPASKTHTSYPPLQYVTNMALISPAGFTQDVVDLPPARVATVGGNPDMVDHRPGELVMRLQFLDYLGTYVEHCHRLPHEDRGMMSMVRTIPHDPVVAIAVPGGTGQASTVLVVHAGDKELPADAVLVTTLTPFPGFDGALSTAVGDVDGDTIPDVAVASGAGMATRINVYSGKEDYKETLFSGLSPFGAATSGATVALADLNADHLDDILVGEGSGGTGRVAVLDATSGEQLDLFTPYEEAFQGSVGVAAGMVEEGGRISLFTAPGPGRPADVRMYNYDLFGDAAGNFPDLHESLAPLRRQVATFDGAEAGYTGGLSITTGYPRAERGGFASLVTSTLTGPAEVRLFTVAAHSHGGGMVSASGVHKAVAYSPDAMRMATLLGVTHLDKQVTGFDDGAIAGVYSTVNGAVLVTAPPGAPGAVVTWKIDEKGVGFVADGPLGPFTGSFVSGI